MQSKTNSNEVRSTSAIDSLFTPVISDQERIACKMLSEGKSVEEIADFLEVQPREVSSLLTNPEVESILDDYYNKTLRYKLTPKALKVVDEVMDQTENVPARLKAALKILAGVDLLAKGAGVEQKTGVFVQTNVNVGDGTKSFTREQIAVIRNNLKDKRHEFIRKRDSTG